MEQISNDDKWEVLKAMYNEFGLVRQHLHSFNEFVEKKLNGIVQERPKIEPDIEGFYVKLEGIDVGEPSVREADGSERTIYPMEARVRNLIYSAPLNLKMRPVYVDAGIEKEEEVVTAYIGRLPIMLKSRSCLLYNLGHDDLTRLGEDPEDPGGYFIINGSERVIVTQEYLVSNRVLVDEGRKGSSTTAVAKVFSTVAGFRSLVSVQRRKDGRLLVNFFSVPRPLPLAVLIKALGVTIDRDIANLVTDDPELIQDLLPTLREAAEIIDQEEALDFIGKRVAVGQTRQYRILRAKQVLDNYLLPHVGKDESFRQQKALYLAQMALKVIELNLGRIDQDDKDHYANKRLKLAGEMLTSLFRVAFHSLYRDIKYQLEKGARRGKLPNLRVAMRADVITERIRHALATGNWVGGKAGVSQLLDRTNYMSTYSHLRRVISPLIRSQAHFEARDLHATHWGKICVSPDTEVLLDDKNSQIPISDLEEKYKHFSITSVDEKSHEQITSGIIAFQRISAHESGKNVLQIETISRRKILATEDHPFLTTSGWVPAGDLKMTDKVLVRPTLNPLSEIDEKDQGVFTILTYEDIEREDDKVELEKIGLLPLDSDNPKLSVLARLLGIILTDGYVGNTVEFYLGSEADTKEICRDLEYIGFESNPIKYKESSYDFDSSQDTITYGTFRTNKGGAFLRLMIGLGAPTGKRTTQEISFPMWILNSSKKVKREFLASFMGGDGAAPWLYRRSGRKDSYKIKLPDLEIHKHPDFRDSQVKFFENLEKLFNEFGVKINHIKTKNLNTKDRVAVNLVFDASKENILQLCHNIGFRYCQEKQHKSQLISEFLFYRETQLVKRMKDRTSVIELYNQGMQAKQIAGTLNLGYRVVTSIIQRRDQERSIVHPKSAWSAGQFMQETLADLETGMLYVPLASIKLTDEDIVCDFTTEKDTHTFVANGFVTHNCPNETPEGPNCVLPNTLVTLPGGALRTIGSFHDNDDWKGSHLISADWNVDNTGSRNLKNCGIARFIRHELNGNSKIYCIKTNTGRKIYATADHPFYSETNGDSTSRTNACDLKIGKNVAVLSTALQRPDWTPLLKYDEIVLDSDTFIKYLPPRSRTWKAALNEAEKLDLIPLRISSSAFPRIVRLLGFVLGDGHLSIRERTGKSDKPKFVVSTIFTGKPADLREIMYDLDILGFHHSGIKSHETTSILDDGRIIQGRTHQVRVYNRVLWATLRALGAVVGDKAKNVPSVPYWLMDCNKDSNKLPIIREFLASLFGCEMSTPTVDKRDGKTFLSPIFSLNVVNKEGNQQKAKNYLEQIVKLCNLFEINFAPKYITRHEGTIRKDGEHTLKFRLHFSSEIQSLYNLYGRIGFIYEMEREKLANFAFAYLNEKIKSIGFRKTVATYVWENRSIDNQELFSKVMHKWPEKFKIPNPEVSLNDIKNWIKIENFNSERIRIQAKNFPTWEEWIKQYSVDFSSNAGLTWEKIKEIMILDSTSEELGYRVVDDFTMNDHSHNFLANGFLTGNCGLVKNLAMQAYISIGTPDDQVIDFILQNCNVTPVTESLDHKGVHILINGNLIATTREAEETFHIIREARRASKLYHEINIAYFEENRVISINTDEGRVRRPLIILDQKIEGSEKVAIPRLKQIHIEKLRRGDMKFSDLLVEGVIEFLDAEEEENSFIAMTLEDITPNHTHVEISPSAILGICASIIPYAEHNQSPRNTYEAGMTKQALGLYSSNFYFRTDRRAHILQAPQTPLVGSKAMDVIGFNDRPAGQNFIVAILSFQGYNIEDAIILNRASVERGLARSHFFRSYVAEEKKYLGGQEDRFEIPQKGVRGYRAKEVYRHLSEVDGIIEPEIEVGGGDILVGRTSRPRFLEEYIELESLESSTPQRRETSIAIRHGEKGIVDSVILTETSEGSTLVKIKVRDQRVPELGDKFASRHGQKGIIGHIVPQADMPFTEDGVVPDLIINPHAIPSRMTVGQIIECMSAIVACFDGKQIDATLFESPDPEDIASKLRSLGFHPYAESVMYDGMTGQKLPARIFIGPTYYQKLHHLVADKIHARARGPIQILTRQPTEGRAREGGLRFGEMERDCLIGHGAALLLKERLLEESDKTEIFICEKCGVIATWDRKKDQTYCSICGNVDTGIYKIAISYAFKLLLQELMSLTIKPQLILDDATH